MNNDITIYPTNIPLYFWPKENEFITLFIKKTRFFSTVGNFGKKYKPFIISNQS